MMSEAEIPAGVSPEELAEAVRILKEDNGVKAIRGLQTRLDEIETKRSERDARDDERWEKLQAGGKTPETPPESVGNPGSPPAGGDGNTIVPPPVKTEEPEKEEKPGRKRWWENGNYSS